MATTQPPVTAPASTKVALIETKESTVVAGFGDLNEKYTQKLCKVSSQHVQLSKQMGEDIEKTCSVLKPVNKSLRQQKN